MTDSPPGVDLDHLATWARVALPAAAPPFRADVIVGGQSNITVLLHDADDRAFVLRRPPLHGVLPTAHDMGREHRIISALVPTPVPVPETLAFCDDVDVLGAPFFVMAYVPGVVLDDVDTATRELDEAARAHSGLSLIDALADLHAVDVDAVGLGDLARRDGFVERQLKRWHTQVTTSKTRDVPAIDRAHELLVGRVPEQVETTVVHGDYRLGNCIVDRGGDVRAVLDWEICTLGDPRADLGYLLATWSLPEDRLRFDDASPTLAPGFVDRQELLERYASRSGRDLSAMPFFVAFSAWRLACILEGVLIRRMAGARGEHDDDGVDAFRDRVDRVSSLAEEYAARL